MRGAVRGARTVSSIRGLAGALVRVNTWPRRDQVTLRMVDAVREGQGHAGSTPATSTILNIREETRYCPGYPKLAEIDS